MQTFVEHKSTEEEEDDDGIEVSPFSPFTPVPDSPLMPWGFANMLYNQGNHERNICLQIALIYIFTKLILNIQSKFI